MASIGVYRNSPYKYLGILLESGEDWWAIGIGFWFFAIEMVS